MAALKIELSLTVPKRRGLAHHAGPCGEAAGPGQRQKNRRRMWTRGPAVVSREGTGETV